jgi:hypothetical protein
MTLYNLTPFTNASSIGDVVISANTLSGGTLTGPWLFGGMSFIIFIVLLVGLKRYEFKDALMASSFASFVLSGFGWYLGIINPNLTYFYLLTLGFAFFWSIVDRN